MRGISSAAPAQRNLGAFGTLATVDDDGIKTSVASSTGAVSYSGGALNGVEITDGALESPRNVTITKAAAAGAYTVGSHITVSGYHWKTKEPMTETHTVTHADNAETFTGKKVFASGTSYPLTVIIEAQADTDGSWKIGVGAAVPIPGSVDWCRATITGNLVVLLTQDDGTTLLTLAVTAGDNLPFSIASIHEGTTGALVALSAGV